MSVDVYYLNALEGESGVTRMPLSELPQWLSDRPGYLVRKIVELRRSAHDPT